MSRFRVIQKEDRFIIEEKYYRYTEFGEEAYWRTAFHSTKVTSKFLFWNIPRKIQIPLIYPTLEEAKHNILALLEEEDKVKIKKEGKVVFKV